MDDYIAKPLRRKEILAMVDKWSKRIVDCVAETTNPQPATTLDDQTSMTNHQSSIVNRQSTRAPMNFEMAIKEFEGDKEFLMEVIDGFLKNVRAQIGTIRQAISDGDAEVVRREAHSIKGGAANLTADDLSTVALELEDIGKSGALEGGIQVLKRLEGEFCRLEGYVKGR
jgi:HPt (histidine-containing phosphotransfer) domain-containing protein